MRQINCYIPIKLRITGRPSDAQLDELGETLVRALTARIAFAEETILTRNGGRFVSADFELMRENYDPSREDRATNGYRMPSYQDRGSLRVVRWRRRRIPSHLKAGILTRGRVRLPTENVRWLLELNRDTTWVSRLAVDLAQVWPEVDVTVELFRVQDLSLSGAELTHVFRQYLELRHAGQLAATPYFVFHLGRLSVIFDLEAALQISLDRLFRVAGVPLPREMTSRQMRWHVLLTYASFPSSIEQYMVPEGVIKAEEAIEAALLQEPIGRLSDILQHPEQFRQALEGPDDRLVVVLVANDEHQVTSLKVLRDNIQQVEQARRSPLLLGYFERSLPDDAKREAETNAGLDPGQLQDARSVLRQIVDITGRSKGQLMLRVDTAWLFPDDVPFPFAIPPRSVAVQEDAIILIQVGGPSEGLAAKPNQVVELLITAAELPEVLERVQGAWRRQVLIREAFRQVEFLGEAVTIQLAIGTAGRLVGPGRVGLATLRQAGLRAAATQAGQALLTRAGLALAGETILNILLPSITFYVHANREELQRTAAGRAFVGAVDTVTILLAIYGLGQLARGGLRILRARIRRLPSTSETQAMLSEVDDLIRRQRAAALRTEAASLEQEIASLRSEANQLERSAVALQDTRPDRAARMFERAARRRRVAAILEQEDVPDLLRQAQEFESGARSAAEDLPGPADIDQLFEQARSETHVIRVPLVRAERNPSLLPRLIRPLLRSRSGNRVVFRVEGGASRQLINVSSNGDVTITRGTTIYLNFGSAERALEFWQKSNRSAGARIIAFEVDEAWVQSLRSAAIPEHTTGVLRGRQPRLVDVRFAEDQMEIPASLIDELQQFIIPGSGRVMQFTP